MPDLYALRQRGMRMGEGNFIGRGVVIDAHHCWLITIGSNCVLAADAMILAHDASTKPSTGYTRLRLTTIGDRVYIGARALVLPGVTVGDDAIIGAGAVVTRDVEPGTMVAGNPAKVVGTTAEHADKHRERMENRPVWPRERWTFATGITNEQKARMAELLSDGEGYVP
jgi:maltose O-acetyltransferase